MTSNSRYSVTVCAVVLKTDKNGNPIYDGKMTNPSSLINYLGFKGTRLNKEYAANAPIATSQNAIPYLAYWDIFKNYFANKQEENFYYVGVGKTVRDYTVTLSDGTHEVRNGETTRALIQQQHPSRETALSPTGQNSGKTVSLH